MWQVLLFLLVKINSRQVSIMPRCRCLPYTLHLKQIIFFSCAYLKYFIVLRFLIHTSGLNESLQVWNIYNNALLQFVFKYANDITYIVDKCSKDRINWAREEVNMFVTDSLEHVENAWTKDCNSLQLDPSYGSWLSFTTVQLPIIFSEMEGRQKCRKLIKTI